MIAIDLFSGAGGMALGAKRAGVQVTMAVECDPHSGTTYKHNFPDTELFNDDIRHFTPPTLPRQGSLVFGGPPCQGFSTSNQRTRTKTNPNNWMFREFIRVLTQTEPEWFVFENVKGLLDTARGYFFDIIMKSFNEIGYTLSHEVIRSDNFGVPQERARLFIIGSRTGKKVKFPKSTGKKVTVSEAIQDLPSLDNGANVSWLPYGEKPPTPYAQTMRGEMVGCFNNLTTRSSPLIIERYKTVPQGGNWSDIPEKLMLNYRDRSRCHTGIYHRLRPDSPSIVLGNFRKNMLIHPVEHRGLSVREAARLQSFPDNFEFLGSIGFQQQQVSNAVPPLLAEAIFKAL